MLMLRNGVKKGLTKTMLPFIRQSVWDLLDQLTQGCLPGNKTVQAIESRVILNRTRFLEKCSWNLRYSKG